METENSNLNNPVPAAAGAPEGAELRKILEAPPRRDTEVKFFLFILFSLMLHLFTGYTLKKTDTTEIRKPSIEAIPQRMAKLIMDKPIKPEKIKAEKLKVKTETESAAETHTEAPKETQASESQSSKSGAPVSAERHAAQVADEQLRFERETLFRLIADDEAFLQRTH